MYLIHVYRKLILQDASNHFTIDSNEVFLNTEPRTFMVLVDMYK